MGFNDFLKCFEEYLVPNILVTGPGDTITGRNEDGTPLYDTVIRYDDQGAKWLLSNNERIACGKLGYPATHNMIIDPTLIVDPIKKGDTVTVGSETGIVYPGENILEQDEIYEAKIVFKDIL